MTGDTRYYKHSDTGYLAKIKGGLAGEAFVWNAKKKQWVPCDVTMEILDPTSDRAFWYDQITEEEAKKITGGQ